MYGDIRDSVILGYTTLNRFLNGVFHFSSFVRSYDIVLKIKGPQINHNKQQLIYVAMAIAIDYT